ncbi:DNA polymerase III subunit gamma/tau [Methylobacillus gramineus]|uniref:DNA polymerase III subunit gamma/tau n=1 Tax=Methylobacillus gramineus TaxID=755169 RepID=UPI001D000C9C|nr:DNA polymerase III subunit gamma/tau [Methylobacillus gramineus]MCB5184195.1 DNA polymerase III subunit gamma/tau [Methylobacillus gramineus]
MSYQVLARKWRPKSFDALVGQEHVVRALTNALEQQRLHHAYLFTGTRGVGKTTLSRILAKSLNCETGITARPCGVCAACVAIDKGSFIDYVEMDAASNRGVEDMTSLLEKAVYAPTQGRYKVYMLDEVHQLTGHAFNAMLKTLEEPPAHVKFILATTDPQKVPVTILSRCLQFNLRQMSSSGISDHLQHVLQQENLPSEPIALQLIARSANGSMRDALSLLDQAIAYGGNSVNEKEVRAMLGAIDQSYLFDLLNSLIDHDGAALLQQARAMEQRTISFDAALNDLANLLHQVAIAQTVPESIANDHPERSALLDIAAKLDAEKLQLYYQIALLARRDLGLAPDEFAGFTMALLRMLAFNPGEQKPSARANVPTNRNTVEATETRRGASAALSMATSKAEEKPAPAPVAQTDVEHSYTIQTASIPAAAQEPEYRPVAQHYSVSAEDTQHIETPITSPSTTAADMEVSSLTRNFDGNWRTLVDRLKLGLARALAQNCELAHFDEQNMTFSVPPSQKHLLGMGYEEKLQAAVEQHFGRKIKLHFDIGGSGNTPAQQITHEKAALQSYAEDAINNDGFVQALVNDFGAHIIPSSIKPLQ